MSSQAAESRNTPVYLDPALERYLRVPEVCARYGISTSSLYRWVEQGRFPAPKKIGPSAVAWKLSELLAYEDAADGGSHAA